MFNCTKSPTTRSKMEIFILLPPLVTYHNAIYCKVHVLTNFSDMYILETFWRIGKIINVHLFVHIYMCIYKFWQKVYWLENQWIISGIFFGKHDSLTFDPPIDIIFVISPFVYILHMFQSIIQLKYCLTLMRILRFCLFNSWNFWACLYSLIAAIRSLMWDL
jgi:hypothetical protein